MYRKNESCHQIMIATLKMAGVAGFEPTNDGVRVRCLTAWRHPNAFIYHVILSKFIRFIKHFYAVL